MSAGIGAAAVLDVVAGAAAAFRAIGRGFGSGSFGVASAGIANATARHVAKAVDRNAAARTVRVTAFLRDESLRPGSPKPI